MNLQTRKKMIAAAMGQQPLDRVIRNLRIVNVYTGRVEPGALGFMDGFIASIDAENLQAREVIDGGGRFALPGLIDTHVHLDSTLLVPERLAELIVPHGTTCMLADPMESANVAGIEGLKALMQSRERLPYHVFLEVCSRVPTAPGLETTGDELGLAEVEQILDWPETVSLGELDPSKVLGLRDEYLLKVEAAHARGKIANGHTAGLGARELAGYACGGLTDDHECVDEVDALARLRLGLNVLVREGSSERNLDLILRGVLNGALDPRHLMFCTDDKHPDDIRREGHINYMVNRAIASGVEPVRAIQMATLNAAQHFRIDHLLGSLAPGRLADVLLVDDLSDITPAQVYFQGELVAAGGRLTRPQQVQDYPAWFQDTVHLTRGRQAADFILPADGAQAHVWVIDLVPGQIVNRRGQASLAVRGGVVQLDPAADVLKLAVVERHGKNGNIGVTFVRGFGLKNGAIASSVSHDHHNIVIAGTNDADMAACAAAVEEMHGGLAVAADGEVLGRLPLPVGGLMTAQPVDEVISVLGEMTAVFQQLGGTLPAPFMALSFISLPTVPELGLTDKGLVDVRQHALISPFVG